MLRERDLFPIGAGFPITAPVSEVLPLLQQRLHQGAANAGVAVSIDSVVNYAHDMQTFSLYCRWILRWWMTGCLCCGNKWRGAS